MLSLKLTLALAMLAVGPCAATPTPPTNTISTIPPPIVPNNSSAAAATRARFHGSAAATIPFNSTSPTGRRRGGNMEGRYGTLKGEGCIYNDATWRCLDVEQSRKNWQSADAQMWQCNGNRVAQFYEIWDDKFGAWSIQLSPMDGSTPYCLDVAGGNAFQGQVVRWWKCNQTRAQSWTFKMNGYGQVVGQISPNGHGDLCLDPIGGEAGNRNGQGMQLWSCLPDMDNNVQIFRMADRGSSRCKR